ncbi:hypothetical protein P4S68_01530 [Pseudoalteromonas sp. Hal099]
MEVIYDFANWRWFFYGGYSCKGYLYKIIPSKPQGLADDSATQKINTDYVKSSKAGVELANQYFSQSTSNAKYSQTIYDQPSPTVSKAISTYTEFANLERRAEVQDLIGVDIYA